MCHIFFVGQEKCIAARYKVRKIGDNCGWRCLLHNGSGGGWKLGRIVQTQGEKPRCLTCLRGCGERCPFSSGSSEIGRGRKRGRGAIGKKRLCQIISSKYSWQLACSVRRKVALSEVHIVSYFYSTTLCNSTLGINFLLDLVSNNKKSYYQWDKAVPIMPYTVVHPTAHLCSSSSSGGFHSVPSGASHLTSVSKNFGMLKRAEARTTGTT